eukprot:2320160-Pyramimonas_sp.AAC.1
MHFCLFASLPGLVDALLKLAAPFGLMESLLLLEGVRESFDLELCVAVGGGADVVLPEFGTFM